ncbi:hypothetical protein PHMEG_00010911 [Phytophthora megakarya]|uniref:Reverse transcriptase RNase H-like domain-containing protein n=1 Tax=Phytophthora megakarya TaxID=4795 RepID=A0A225WE84_9STRA|nr:hypothetical protein PHMEG_00010911 [Phytophthora megakarya]
MAVGSVENSAFTCKYGLFEWLDMPFGLDADFKLKLKKYKFAPSDILPNPEKVKAVVNVKRPHDLHTRFKLYVDYSKLTVEACLMQTVDGRERVIVYASKPFVGSEKN